MAWNNLLKLYRGTSNEKKLSDGRPAKKILKMYHRAHICYFLAKYGDPVSFGRIKKVDASENLSIPTFIDIKGYAENFISICAIITNRNGILATRFSCTVLTIIIQAGAPIVTDSWL